MHWFQIQIIYGFISKTSDMHVCCLPSWKAEINKWGQNWGRQLVFPSLGQICGRALSPAAPILNHYNFHENAAHVSSHKILCLCQGSHGSPSSHPLLPRFLDEREMEAGICYDHMKTTCASLFTPKTTLNAIHSFHNLKTFCVEKEGFVISMEAVVLVFSG